MSGDIQGASEQGVTRLTPDTASQWTEKAQRGAVLCYAEGYKASAAGEEVNTRLHHLVAQGYLYFKQQRCVREGVRVGFQYLIERSSRPWGQPLKVVR